MKSIILLATLSFSLTISFGQSTLCEPTETTLVGKILSEIKSQGQASFILTVKKTDKKYKGYRICEHNYLQVDSLHSLLTDLQIDSLLTCQNGTLKVVGFILFSRRHNSKDTVLQKLSYILRQEYIVMASSCSDAITFSNIARYCYDLLTKSNFFYKPSFQLDKTDKMRLEKDIDLYERTILDN